MTVTTTWDLFDDLRATQDELLLRLTAGHNGRPAQRNGSSDAMAWAPAVDISERKDAYLVTAEIPGVSAGDIEVGFDNGLLTIQGERHRAKEVSVEQVHRSERPQGRFRRSMTLPSNVDTDKIEASARDGVLQILVPKRREDRGRRIQVRGSEHAAVAHPADLATYDPSGRFRQTSGGNGRRNFRRRR
jgi:HSP20 family protein